MRRLNKAVQFCALPVVLAFAAPAAAEPVTVVALGDSLTAGYGLPEGQGFVPQLQAWLEGQGIAAEIVNAGVSGDTTAGGLARLDWALSEGTDAMIVALGGNDLLRGIPPAASRANLAAILTEVAEARGLPVLVIGLEAPGNYGPAFQEAFDAMYPELAAEYGALHEDSFLGPLVTELDAATARQRYMQADGIHPNREGVGVIVEALGPSVAELVARAGQNR
ncbi:arylesterase [Jannaschia seohaensis]|uniref:Acyl-CoA thioesterase-1 n=1 Tax=Jannaschia seohaensis TaxID=475081 RepID=A0A2Y9AVQ4_9RHOB|nr:arylesterase [Jannaschia seohaensis]PWJ18083.1 acyl-CoA thioesterase-1 [Jannaschia seohaensis]SSA46607.1 acyl-CoA thioesterase-1 [Jannaschia seohaensis]